MKITKIVKKMVITTVVAGLTMVSVIGCGTSKEVQDSEQILIQWNELDKQYKNLSVTTTEAMEIINSKLKETPNMKFNSEDKSEIGKQLLRLQKISSESMNVSKPTIEDMDNFDMYINTIKICSSIDKFNINFAYAIDNNNITSLESAAKELTNISNIMQEVQDIKENREG